MYSRRRVLLLAFGAALAAGGVASTVAFLTRRPSSEDARAREGAPPLALDAIGDGRETARALLDAEELYADGRQREALERFEAILAAEPESVEAAVGAAIARWPAGTVPRLEELAAIHPRSGLVQLHLGLALLWQGSDAAAAAAWRRAEDVDPDSLSAIRAESFLHPDMPRGRPIFIPSSEFPPEIANLPAAEQLERLEQRAAASGFATDWIAYGAALQHAGRSISARSAYDRAVRADPESAEAQVAAAVALFEKDDPAQAFSKLGPLSRAYPDEPVVRFHLGLLLLWLGDVVEARKELELARGSSGSFYARQASDLLERLDELDGG